MSVTSPHRPSPDDATRPSVAQRLAAVTTRLVLVAVIAGGLLTVAANLWKLRTPGFDAAFTEGNEVAPADDLLQAGLPIQQRVVRGDEAAARGAVVQAGRERMPEALSQAANLRASPTVAPAPEEPFDNAVELARDPDGKWTIHEIQEPRRLVVGVAREGREPTIVFWGGYDETGPDEWTTWTMLLPLPEM